MFDLGVYLERTLTEALSGKLVYVDFANALYKAFEKTADEYKVVFNKVFNDASKRKRLLENGTYEFGDTSVIVDSRTINAAFAMADNFDIDDAVSIEIFIRSYRDTNCFGGLVQEEALLAYHKNAVHLLNSLVLLLCELPLIDKSLYEKVIMPIISLVETRIISSELNYKLINACAAKICQLNNEIMKLSNERKRLAIIQVTDKKNQNLIGICEQYIFCQIAALSNICLSLVLYQKPGVAMLKDMISVIKGKTTVDLVVISLLPSILALISNDIDLNSHILINANIDYYLIRDRNFLVSEEILAGLKNSAMASFLHLYWLANLKHACQVFNDIGQHFDYKDQILDPALQAITNGAIAFAFEILTYVNGPNRSKVQYTEPLLVFNLDEEQKLIENIYVHNDRIHTNMLRALQNYCEVIISHLTDVWRILKFEEEDRYAVQQNNHGQMTRTSRNSAIELLFATMAAVYEHLPVGDDTFIRDVDSNLYGFITWASTCQTPSMHCWFVLLIAALCNSCLTAESVHRLLCDDLSVGHIKKTFKFKWKSLLQTLQCYASQSRIETMTDSVQFSDKRKGEHGLEPHSSNILLTYLHLMCAITRFSWNAREQLIAKRFDVDVLSTLLELTNCSLQPIVRGSLWRAIANLVVDAEEAVRNVVWISILQGNKPTQQHYEKISSIGPLKLTSPGAITCGILKTDYAPPVDSYELCSFLELIGILIAKLQYDQKLLAYNVYTPNIQMSLEYTICSLICEISSLSSNNNNLDALTSVALSFVTENLLKFHFYVHTLNLKPSESIFADDGGSVFTHAGSYSYSLLLSKQSTVLKSISLIIKNSRENRFDLKEDLLEASVAQSLFVIHALLSTSTELHNLNRRYKIGYNRTFIAPIVILSRRAMLTELCHDEDLLISLGLLIGCGSSIVASLSLLLLVRLSTEHDGCFDRELHVMEILRNSCFRRQILFGIISQLNVLNLENSGIDSATVPGILLLEILKVGLRNRPNHARIFHFLLGLDIDNFTGKLCLNADSGCVSSDYSPCDLIFQISRLLPTTWMCAMTQDYCGKKQTVLSMEIIIALYEGPITQHIMVSNYMIAADAICWNLTDIYIDTAKYIHGLQPEISSEKLMATIQVLSLQIRFIMLHVHHAIQGGARSVAIRWIGILFGQKIMDNWLTKENQINIFMDILDDVSWSISSSLNTVHRRTENLSVYSTCMQELYTFLYSLRKTKECHLTDSLVLQNSDFDTLYICLDSFCCQVVDRTVPTLELIIIGFLDVWANTLRLLLDEHSPLADLEKYPPFLLATQKRILDQNFIINHLEVGLHPLAKVLLDIYLSVYRKYGLKRLQEHIKMSKEKNI